MIPAVADPRSPKCSVTTFPTWCETNVDVLSHVTWLLLEVFGLGSQDVDKMSQWCL